MSRQMPQKMEELLYRIKDPDIIREIQHKWNDLVIANDNYERNYPQQFANQVEGNLKFKEQKTIPTPAEQMQVYESMVIAQIQDHLDDKQQPGQEATYELKDDSKATPDQVQLNDRFRLTFTEVTQPQQKEEMPPKGKAYNDMDQSQELNVTWLKDYKAQKEAQNKTDKELQPDTYNLQLNFGKLETPDKSEIEPEPQEPEMDKD
jgi:hypothetical protein